MKPKRASARQKWLASRVSVTRASRATRGIETVVKVRASTFSCSERFFLTCQDMTGGVSFIERLRKTAVPGTRAMRPDSSWRANSINGVWSAAMLAPTACTPRCHTHMKP